MAGLLTGIKLDRLLSAIEKGHKYRQLWKSRTSLPSSLRLAIEPQSESTLKLGNYFTNLPIKLH